MLIKSNVLFGLTFGGFHGFRDEPSTGLVSLVKHVGGAFQAVSLLQHNEHHPLLLFHI